MVGCKIKFPEFCKMFMNIRKHFTNVHLHNTLLHIITPCTNKITLHNQSMHGEPTYLWLLRSASNSWSGDSRTTSWIYSEPVCEFINFRVIINFQVIIRVACKSQLMNHSWTAWWFHELLDEFNSRIYSWSYSWRSKKIDYIHL